MKVNVRDISAEGITLDLKEEGSVLAELAGGLDYTFNSPVVAHLRVTRSNDIIRIDGDVETHVMLECGRCLKEFDYAVRSDFSLFYMQGREEAEEKELTEEDIEITYFEGDLIDTNDILLEQVSLEIPIKHLCSPECKGLCPRCGADLNEGVCGCKEEERIDPRFAALKNFKVRR